MEIVKTSIIYLLIPNDEKGKTKEPYGLRFNFLKILIKFVFMLNIQVHKFSKKKKKNRNHLKILASKRVTQKQVPKRRSTNIIIDQSTNYSETIVKSDKTWENSIQ